MLSKKTSLLFLTTSLLSPAAFAQKAAVAVTDIPTSSSDASTAIIIQKGDTGLANPDFEVLQGKDDISGDQLGDKKKALASWKEACAEWKTTLRDLNKDSLMTVSCGSPKLTKEDYQFSYASMGTYRLRVRIRDEKRK